MKKVLKFVFVLAFVFGGWALAAASLHVVRGPGSMLHGYVPVNVQIVPKNTLSFKEIYIDTTKWSAADVAAHETFVNRLKQANKLDLLQAPAPAAQATDAHPAAAAATSATAAAPAPAEHTSKSIFDFGK